MTDKRVGRGQGRPRDYRLLTWALDPLWTYTPGAVADFADLHGLLAVMQEGELVSLDQPRLRARVNFGRQRSLKHFPRKGDGRLCVHGRWFASWFGYRWDGYLRSEPAFQAHEALFLPLWARLNPYKTYAAAELLAAWRKLPVPRRPAELSLRAGASWHKTYRLAQALLLVRRAQQRGMNLVDAYPSSEWAGAGKARTTPLRALSCVPFFFTHEGVVTLTQFLDKAQQREVVSAHAVAQLKNLRFSLREMARRLGFPEHGDSLVPVTPDMAEPAWSVSRWRRAFVWLNEWADAPGPGSGRSGTGFGDLRDLR